MSLDPWEGHFTLCTCPIGKNENLLEFVQKEDDDRIIGCSIWSPNQEVIILQRFGDYFGIVRQLEHMIV
jgi:hypothetical protein